MFREHEWPSLEQENAAAVCSVVDEQVIRNDSTEGTAAYDDQIELAPSPGNGLVGAIDRFLQCVAQEASHIVQRE